ncbi:MAG: AI-2E family transporter [Planctomycetota bacterium]
MAQRRKQRNDPKRSSDTEKSNAPESVDAIETEPHSDDGSSRRKEILFPQLPSLSRIMSVVMLVFGILAVGVLFYQLMIGFFVPLFLAALLVVIFRPVHNLLLQKLGNRRRIAAGLTTSLILLLVLLPGGILVSVATTQFTILLAQLNLTNMTTAVERVRSQVGLSLPHPAHYRELDQIVDALGIAGSSEAKDKLEQADELDQAAEIIQFLQSEQTAEGDQEKYNTDTVAGSQAQADTALANLETFATQLRQLEDQSESDANEPLKLASLNVNEQFEQMAAKTAASIRVWMHVSLGGALRSQLRLLANPGEADFAALIRRVRETLQPRFVRLTSATGSILVQLAFGLLILVVAVYFFLIDGAVMIRTLMRLSPMDDAYEHQLLMEFDRTSRAVVLASALSAIVQGMLATIGYWMCGFDQIVLLFFLTSLMALVPFLGAASIWLPCTIWLGFVDQRWWAAGLLALYGATVVSSIDNVIKVFVLHGRSQLHPLFALLSVIGGVSVFGPIGILVGPMVVVFLQTLLEILNSELRADAASRVAEPTS